VSDHPTDDNPDPNVRHDIGGWISGPCLPAGGEQEQHTRYYIEVGAEDDRLDAILRSIREREDSGEITTREAADRRIAALENHLAACRALRVRYLGGE
jgi:hypothetical protein